MEEIKKYMRKKIKLAEEIVESIEKLDEKYKIPAFEKTLRVLLEGSPHNEMKFKPTLDEKRDETNVHLDSARTFAGFIRGLNAKSHADKTLAIAYFLLKIRRKPVFTKEIVEAEYMSAFFPRSKNTNTEINGLIQRGLIMPHGEKVDSKKAFVITNDGMEFVEKDLIKK